MPDHVNADGISAEYEWRFDWFFQKGRQRKRGEKKFRSIISMLMMKAAAVKNRAAFFSEFVFLRLTTAFYYLRRRNNLMVSGVKNL